MRVDGFDWDAGNLFKNETKHGISKGLIEWFFKQDVWVAPDPNHSTEEERFLAIGSGPVRQPMIVVFTLRARDGLKLIRPISARFMHAKETEKYVEAFTKNEK